MGPYRDSRSASHAPTALRWVFGSLRRRFVLVLSLLALVSVVPWLTSLNATQQLHGLAQQIDRAGSLRYRFMELGMSERRGPPSQAQRAHLESIIAQQRKVLQSLIEGNGRMQSPPCDSPVVCERLKAHLARWNDVFAPEAFLGTGGGGGSLESRTQAIAELKAIDQTVHLMAGTAEARVRSAERSNLLAGIGVLILVILVGFGIWDAFSRISRVRHATMSTGAEEKLLEIGNGPDEVAALARTLAKGIREFDERNEADRERAKALAMQQRAVHSLAIDLKAWLAGERGLDYALRGVAECMTCEAAWLRSGVERGSSTLLGATGIDSDLRSRIATGGYETAARESGSDPVGAARLVVHRVSDGRFKTLITATIGGSSAARGTLCLASTDPEFSLSDEQGALLHTFTRHVSTALVAHDLLEERELREEVATLLATLPSLNQRGEELAALIARVVDHDLALVNVVGEGHASSHTWRLDADGARRDDSAWSDDAREDVVRRRGHRNENQNGNFVPRAAQHLEGRLLVPLRAGDEQVGTLLLGRAQGDFRAREVEAANAIIPMLASAIARMRLEEILRLGEQASAFDAFSRMLAHEVRNPLNSMVLHADLLGRRLRRIGLDAEQQEPLDEHVGVLRGEIERLNELVEHYLRLTKTGAPARLEPLSLQDVAEEVVGVHAPALAEHSVAIRLDLPLEPAKVMADAARIKQVLHNLVRNSLDAMSNGDGHRLVVAIDRVDQWWELSVRDTGHGIPESAAVFSPSFSTKPTGGGMGLPLSLQIARLHGGALVARRPAGGGAEFVLSLPAIREADEDVDTGDVSETDPVFAHPTGDNGLWARPA
jgi:signal transduction histidine kinase